MSKPSKKSPEVVRYVAVISAHVIWKYKVTFYDGPPVAWGGNSELYGWENEVYSCGCAFLWTAKIAARKGLKRLHRRDMLNAQLGSASVS